MKRSPRQFKKEVNARISDYIRGARQKVGISQMELSIQLGQSPKFIYRIENGYCEADVFEFLEIMEALGVDPSQAIREIAPDP